MGDAVITYNQNHIMLPQFQFNSIDNSNLIAIQWCSGAIQSNSTPIPIQFKCIPIHSNSNSLPTQFQISKYTSDFQFNSIHHLSTIKDSMAPLPLDIA